MILTLITIFDYILCSKWPPFYLTHNFTLIIELLTVLRLFSSFKFSFCIIINLYTYHFVLDLFKWAKEPTKHEIYILKRDLPENFFKKLMKISLPRKNWNFHQNIMTLIMNTYWYQKSLLLSISIVNKPYSIKIITLMPKTHYYLCTNIFKSYTTKWVTL